MRYRQAEQLQEDAVARHLPALVPWVHEASNPFADWYFGDPQVARDIVSEWMRRPSSELHLGRGLLMMEEEALVGCLIGMDGAVLNQCRAADFMTFCEELGDGPEAEAVIEEVVPVARALFPAVEDDTFYISRVAVDPSRRGEGLGRSLVAQTIRLRRADGFRKFRLDVSDENTAAIRTYQSLGFQIASTARSPEAGFAYHAMELVSH